MRGRAADQLTPQVIYWLGRAIADQVVSDNSASVIVGADGRLSGPELKQALIAGLREGGADVLDTGFAATPVVYFAAFQQDTANAVVITASHNPPEQNGLKVIVGNQALMDEEITELAQSFSRTDLSSGSGQLIEQDQIANYVHHLAQIFDIKRRFKIALDTGNGIGGPVAERLFSRLNQDLTHLFSVVDGHFPNHSPDPCVVDNLTELKSVVRSNGADIGIAFDGDADRIVILDETGTAISPDHLLMLLIDDQKTRNQEQPLGKVVIDVKTSSAVANQIQALGGEVVLGRTGHSPMKRLIQASAAQLGGELSAHYYFADWFGFDDGLYTALRFLSLLERSGHKASELVAQLPTLFATPELRIDVPEAAKFAIVEKLKALEFSEKERSELDGLRVEFDEGWALVRASNTEAALVARFEARSTDKLTELYTRFRDQITRIEPSAVLPDLALI